MSAVPADHLVGSGTSHLFEGELAVGASVVGLVVCGPSDDGCDAFVGSAVVVGLVDIRHGCSVLLCLCQRTCTPLMGVLGLGLATRITVRCPPKARKRKRKKLMMSDFVWVAVAAMIAAFATIMGACVVGAYMMWEEFRDR